MEIILRAFELPLKHTFTISRESIDVQPSIIVELRDSGFSGFGEATSNPYYNITVPMMIDDLENLKSIIEKVSDETPEQFWAKMQPRPPKNFPTKDADFVQPSS